MVHVTCLLAIELATTAPLGRLLMSHCNADGPPPKTKDSMRTTGAPAVARVGPVRVKDWAERRAFKENRIVKSLIGIYCNPVSVSADVFLL